MVIISEALYGYIITIISRIPIILFPTLGVVLLQKTGMLGLGCEGIMLIGAVVSYLVVLYTKNFVIGLLASIIVSMIFGYFYVTLLDKTRFTDMALGVILWLFGMGFSSFLYRAIIGVRPIYPTIEQLPPICSWSLCEIPVLVYLTRLNILVYVAILAVILMHLVFYKTLFGISLRAIGDDPRSAELSGVLVSNIRLRSSIVAHALMGLGGAYMVLITGGFTENLTGGRGWIAIALAVLSGWEPKNVLWVSAMFTVVDSLQYYIQATFPVIPPQLPLSMPYLTAIITLVLVRGRSQPAYLGKRYEKVET